MGFVENVNKLAQSMPDNISGSISTLNSEVATINTKLGTIETGANAYVHPAKHDVSIIDGSLYPSQFVKTDSTGHTGFDYVHWSEIVGKPADMNNVEFTTNKGVANGYVPLGADGKISPAYLSSLNTLDVFTPADEASMLALSQASLGDIAVRQDNGYSYMLIALPASTLANWKQLNTAGVISVNGMIGAVTLSSTDIAEGTNLYYTNARVSAKNQAMIKAGTNVSLAYDAGLDTITISANDTSVNWSELQGVPTTVSGYGITDAYTKTEINTLAGNYVTNTYLTTNYYTSAQVNALAGNYTTTASLNSTLPTQTIVNSVNSANPVNFTVTPTVGGVAFNAPTATTSASCTGNSATATKLQTARNINGVAFDGSADISIGTGFKNYIINGNFRVNQRSYASGTATSTTNQYTFDRWRIPTSGQSLTFTTTNGSTTVTAPASGIEQVIENLNIDGGSYVVSNNGTATVTVSQSSDNVTYTTVTPVGAVYTITGGYYVKINFANGTVNKPQFEKGNIATNFENRPYGLELSLCKRYYEFGGYQLEIDNGGTSAAYIGYNRSFNIQKRAIPTVTINDSSTGVTSVVTNGIATTDFNIRGTSGTGIATHILAGTWTASSEL